MELCYKMFDVNENGDYVSSSTNRIYKKETLEKALAEYKNHGCGYGELWKGGDAIPQCMETNMHDVSHKIDDVYQEGNALMVKMEPLDTPQGQLLQKMLNVGTLYPVMKSVGTMDENGVITEVTQIFGVDLDMKSNVNHE